MHRGGDIDPEVPDELPAIPSRDEVEKSVIVVDEVALFIWIVGLVPTVTPCPVPMHAGQGVDLVPAQRDPFSLDRDHVEFPMV